MLQELQTGSHIYAIENALDADFCADLVARFEQHTHEQYPGRIGQAAVEDLQIKRSTDLVISGKPHWRDADKRLFASLAQGMRLIRETQVFFRGRFKDNGYAIQKTSAGEYFHWHVDGGSHDFSARQLVAIWYLNDVAGPGGETEFRHQQVKVRPEIGKLILFPPFWTHEHRGVTLQQGVKYIATCWVVFA